MPFSIVREARSELALIMGRYHELATTVLPDDDDAIRFAVYLGFHDRDGSASRKELIAAIKADPKYKIPVGDSYVIGLGYHPGAPH